MLNRVAFCGVQTGAGRMRAGRCVCVCVDDVSFDASQLDTHPIRLIVRLYVSVSVFNVLYA